MQNEARALLALTDHNLSLQIIEKFKNKYPHCPLMFEVTEDGQRAIEEVKLYKPFVVVIDFNLPSLNGSELATEILKAYSDCQIMVAADQKDQVDVGLVKINLPILDWEKFFHEFINCLPLDFQIQYGLFSRNTQLHEELQSWSKKYINEAIKNKPRTMSWIHFSGKSPEQRNEDQASSSKEAHTNANAISTSTPDFSKFIWAELTVMALIIGGLVGSYFLNEDSGFLRAGIQISLSVLLLVNGIGFVLLRIFSRARK